MATHRYQSSGGVIIRDGKMLVLDRPSRNEVRLPKGHIESGETGEKAALREVTEETGYADLEIVVDLGSQVVEFDYLEDHYTRTERYFLMRLNSDRRLPRTAKDEADFRVRWVPHSQAEGLLTYNAESGVACKAIATYMANQKTSPV